MVWSGEAGSEVAAFYFDGVGEPVVGNFGGGVEVGVVDGGFFFGWDLWVRFDRCGSRSERYQRPSGS